MSDIPHLDARVDAMQKEFLGQLSMQSARLAAMASELAACREELKEAQAARDSAAKRIAEAQEVEPAP